MKNTILQILFLLTIQVVCGQQKEIDSLKNIINKQRKDTTEMKAIMKIVDLYYTQSGNFGESIPPFRCKVYHLC